MHETLLGVFGSSLLLGLSGCGTEVDYRCEATENGSVVVGDIAYQSNRTDPGSSTVLVTCSFYDEDNQRLCDAAVAAPVVAVDTGHELLGRRLVSVSGSFRCECEHEGSAPSCSVDVVPDMRGPDS